VAEVGTWDHANIDLVAEFGENARRRAANAVSAGFINAWSYSDIFVNASGQLDQLLPLKFRRQVPRIGVLVRLLLDERRIIPRMEMSSNFASARLVQIAERLEAFGRAADRVI
jgi:hypothetical protein